MSEGFSVPNSSRDFAAKQTTKNHCVLRNAVLRVASLTGRSPIIVPAVKNSAIGFYANLNSEISLWENPWGIVSEMKKSDTQVLEGFSSSCAKAILPKDLTCVEARDAGHENFDSPLLTDVRPTAKMHNGGIAINPSVVENVIEGSQESQDFSLIARPLSGNLAKLVHKETADSDPHVEALPAASTWIPRFCHGSTHGIRIFPYELQNIMHAFGEERFCSAGVLEFMEDAVRDIVQRVALGLSSRLKSNKLTVYDVSTCIRHDPRALLRLLLCLQRARQTAHDLHVSKPTCREWDYLRHRAILHGQRIDDYPLPKHFQELPMVRIHESCCEKARTLFWRGLGLLFKVQHEQCLHSCLTDRYSRCPTAIMGKRRLDLFREWLALPQDIEVSDGTLHALGSLAREATAIITQTALIQRCQNMQYSSYEQTLINAIGPGICAGIMIPLSPIQTSELYTRLCDMEFDLLEHRNWSFRAKMQGKPLQLNHIREAWRRLNEPVTLDAHRPFWVGF